MLTMKKVGIMIDDGFHDLELWLPYYRFKEEGVDFDILGWENSRSISVRNAKSVIIPAW